MGMFDRIKNVFKANINEAINKMEDPEKMLEQSIVDMEKEYVLAKKSVGSAKADEIKLTKKVNELKQEESKWQRNAEIALHQNNEEMARKNLSRKKEATEELTVVDRDRKNIANSINQLVENLKMMEKEIEEAKRKKNLLKSRMEIAEAKKKINAVKNSMSKTGEGAFSSFNRMQEKAEKMINEADADEIINEELSGEDLDSQFAEMEFNSSVDAELEALKASMK